MTRSTLAICFIIAATAVGDDWPQWGGPQRDNVWRETGVTHKFGTQPKYQWRTPLGMGYAGPAVAAGKVYVMDRVLGDGVSNPSNPFANSPVDGRERVHCLDAATGKPLWVHEYPCEYRVGYPNGPRVTPAVDGDRVYTLGTMGDFYCLNASDGKPIWSKKFLKDYDAQINTWGYSSSPLVDGDLVIAVAGGKNACVVAFDKTTGAEKWRALDSKDFGYCSPVIFEAGGVRQLIAWTPVEIAALDPKTGKSFWREPFQVKAGMTIATPTFDAKTGRLLVTGFYSGPKMMELAAGAPTAKLLWEGTSRSEMQTDKLHCVMCTPALADGYIYGVCSYGQLRCLEAATGKRLWESVELTGKGRWWNAFIVKHEDAYFVANEQGELIAAEFSPQGAKVLSRMQILEATTPLQRNRKVVWSHPAFAMKSCFARNDKEIVRIDLSAEAGNR